MRSKAAADSTVITDPVSIRTFERSFFVLVSLGLLTIALGYSVLENGGTGLADWNVSLLIIGLVGFAYWLRTPTTSLAPLNHPWLRWAVLLFPAYVAFQLVPLPLPVIRILSPERAQLFESLRNLMATGWFVPLSIAPATTFAYLFRILGYTLTFVLIRDITTRSSARPWGPAVPLISIAAMETAFGFFPNTDGVQVQGTYANKNHFAGLLEMVLPLAVMYAIALFRRRTSRSAPAMLGALKASAVSALSILIFVGLIYSMSKMGFVSGLCGLFVMGAVAFGAAKIQLWKKYLAVAGLGAIFLFASVFVPPDELIQAFGGLFSSTGANTEGRWPIWVDTLRLIGAYPLFGCGLGNYETAFLKYQTAVVDRDFTFAHNDYLELAAELGAVGLIILASLMLPIVIKAFRAATRGPDRDTRYIGLGCVGGITAIGLHSLADFNMYIPANAMLLTWICGISAGLPSRSVPAVLPEPVSNRVFFRKFAIAISCLLVVYAPAWMLFETAFRSDPRTEKLFCRFGICDTDTVLAAQTLERGGTIAAVSTPELVEAVRRDAAAPQRWCDLGDAMLSAGETGRARYCFSRALALGPNIPFMLVRAADFHFSLKENREGLDLMARASGLDSAYLETVFSDYERRGIAVDDILRYGLPQDPRVSKEYLRRLLDQDRASDAIRAWNSMLSRGYADDKLANEYVEFLAHAGKLEAAQQAWARYACDRDKGYPESNRIFNGDFESDPSGSRFDWRIEAPMGASIAFDQEVRHAGARSLRIQFDGTQNVSNVGVSQTLFLKPGRYRFQAYVRTKDVSTDEGVTFNVADPEAPKRLSFTTESMLGTNDWKRIEHKFQVTPGTGLVQVSLIRKPSLRFDNLIRGTVWVDQVRIW